MICDTCKGTRNPRQCRNSAAFRDAQYAPAECPYGIALNNLPIGDNLPKQRRMSIHRAERCRHLDVVPAGGCCDNEYFCTRGGRRRIVTPKTCGNCRIPVEEPASQPEILKV